MKLLRLALVGFAVVVVGASSLWAAGAGRLDGAARVPVAGLGGSLQNPCFSPVGDRLVITQFTKRYNRGLSVVRVVPLRGGRPLATLSPGNAQSVNLPGSCWNGPTGRVTYTSDPSAGDQVFIVPAGGGSPTAVTRPPIVAFEPSFSPSGREIVFERFRPGRSEIWKVRVDGSGLRRLTHGANDRQPNWSPAGDRIAFQRQPRSDEEESEEPFDLYTVPAGGGTVRNVTRTEDTSETDVSFSPSGRYLVFSSDGDGIDIASLFTISTAGASRKQLTRTRGIYDGAPSWSPNGATIAFESTSGDPDVSNGTQIWTIPAPAGRR